MFRRKFDRVDGFPNKRDIVEYVDSFLESYDIVFPRTFSVSVKIAIACQSALETDYGNSRLCFDNCNLFGMKHPVSRPTYSIGEKSLHASYDCYVSSVKDLVLWITYHKPTRDQTTDVSLWLDFLKSNRFCPSNTYKATIHALWCKYQSKCLTKKSSSYEKS